MQGPEKPAPIAEPEMKTKSERVDLSPTLHKQLGRAAADEEISMADLARKVVRGMRQQASEGRREMSKKRPKSEGSAAAPSVTQPAVRPIPGIEQTPGVCGGDPCIRKTQIPVWVLVRARQLGMTEAELLADYPTLQAQDLVNAWAM